MYAVRHWNPWREFQQLRNEVGRLFQSDSHRTSQSGAALNVWANDDAAIVTTELPGVDPDQLDISVTNGVLKIAGKFENETLQEGHSFQRRERVQQQFERSLQLPFAVDADKTQANYRNGVLEVRLTRSEQEKPKRVTVNAG